MAVINYDFTISTRGFNDVIDITSKVEDIVLNVDVKDSTINVFVMSSTASIITIEYEPGLVLDIPSILENIVPVNKIYEHDNVWHEGNAYSYIRASILGNNINLPVTNKKIQLDTWQKIVLIDFDNKPNVRKIIVSVVY